MKKYICFCSRQALNDHLPYQAMDNQRLSYGATNYPIVPVINGYGEAGDEIEVLAFTENLGECQNNYEKLNNEVLALCEEKGMILHGGAVTRIEFPLDDAIDSQLVLFDKMIDHIDDGDILYACTTYSSKASVITELMALRFARMIKKNVFIECVTYGTKIFQTGERRIYDVTALVQLDDIMRIVTLTGRKEPQKLLRKLIADISADK